MNAPKLAPAVYGAGSCHEICPQSVKSPSIPRSSKNSFFRLPMLHCAFKSLLAVCGNEL